MMWQRRGSRHWPQQELWVQVPNEANDFPSFLSHKWIFIQFYLPSVISSSSSYSYPVAIFLLSSSSIGDDFLSDLSSNYYRNCDDKAMLPIRWMAPESLLHRTYDAKSDVWWVLYFERSLQALLFGGKKGSVVVSSRLYCSFWCESREKWLSFATLCPL